MSDAAPASSAPAPSALTRRVLDPAVARDVKVLFVDCDGVLTDGRMIYVDRPRVGDKPSPLDAATVYEAKNFHVRDGMAAVLLRMAGVQVVLITGEASPMAARRAAKLQFEGSLLGIDDRVAAAGDWLRDHGFTFADAAHVGDEVNDLGLMRRVPLSFAPADCSPLVAREVTYRSPVEGGGGVLRDVIYELLDARGQLDDILERYIAGERPASGTGT